MLGAGSPSTLPGLGASWHLHPWVPLEQREGPERPRQGCSAQCGVAVAVAGMAPATSPCSKLNQILPERIKVRIQGPNSLGEKICIQILLDCFPGPGRSMGCARDPHLSLHLQDLHPSPVPAPMGRPGGSPRASCDWKHSSQESWPMDQLLFGFTVAKANPARVLLGTNLLAFTDCAPSEDWDAGQEAQGSQASLCRIRHCLVALPMTCGH